MQTYEIRLNPKGFLQSFQNPSFPFSNTLFGAICWGIRTIYGEKKLEGLLNSSDLNPPFILTSSFPLLQNKEKGFSLRFFPKPKLPSLKLKEIAEEIGTKSYLFQVASEYKSFRKIAFLSESLFLEVLEGKGEKSLFLEYLEGRIKKVRDIALKKEEFERLWPKGKPLPPESFPRARNKVDRLISSSTGMGELFYEFKLSLPPEMCLFFLLKTEDLDFFKPVLRFLEDNGIGGERSVGVNHFSIEIPKNELELSLPSKGRKLVTLSRWKVDPEELDMSRENEFHYELLPLRGKLETGFDFKDKGIVWKRKAFYFAEGSVLVAKRESQSYYGGLWKSLEFEGKKIKDYGIAFPAFFKEG